MSNHERLARLEAKFRNLGRAKERAETTRRRVLPVASGSGGPKLQFSAPMSDGRNHHGSGASPQPVRSRLNRAFGYRQNQLP